MTVGMNLLIMRAFYIDKRLRTYSNQYILNITISDLLVGFVMAIRCSIILYDTWIFGDALGIIFVGVQNIVLGVSVLGVIAICLDRYVATHHPIRHFQRKKKRIAYMVNAIIWMVSLAFWLPMAVIWDFVQPPPPKDGNDPFAPNYGYYIYSTVALAVCRLAIPFIVIATLYLKIYIRVKGSGSKYLSDRFELKTKEETRETRGNTVATIQCPLTINAKNYVANDNAVDDAKDIYSRKASSRGQPFTLNDTAVLRQNNVQSSSVNQLEKPGDAISMPSRSKGFSRSRKDRLSTRDNHKIMRTLTFITAAFFITWLPISINVVYTYGASNNVVFTEISRWVTYLNSLINPISYALAQPIFRENILRILKFRR
ncbi:muscarinic acetylcholine receptor M5-like [Lytechinus variegatus]|uniref:muscarinic acetylcholine receptor M5-like n=1 Tax=Lytechinus variegatus TaxID=7654 RepID=UPI001BB2CF0F|nr:muscarinic acetylcholine receptor M5-like [Lytechinus variegatus]